MLAYGGVGASGKSYFTSTTTVRTGSAISIRFWYISTIEMSLCTGLDSTIDCKFPYMNLSIHDITTILPSSSSSSSSIPRSI